MERPTLEDIVVRKGWDGKVWVVFRGWEWWEVAEREFALGNCGGGKTPKSKTHDAFFFL